MKLPSIFQNEYYSSFKTYLLGHIAIALTPLILLEADISLKKYVVPYLVFMGLLIPVSAWLLATHKFYSNKLIKSVPSLFFIIPYLLVALLPLSRLNLLFFLIIMGFGLLLPYKSKSATVWFYTLGRRFPLPEQHNWLIGKENRKTSGAKYKKSLKNSVKYLGLFVPIGMILATLLSSGSESSSVFIFIKITTLFVIFGLTLSAGAELKKRELESVNSYQIKHKGK